MIGRSVLAGIIAVVPLCVVAQDLVMPGASRQLANRVSPLDSYDLPVGPYGDGTVPVRRLEGRIERQTWRLDGTAVTTLQLLSPLRDQIKAAGYEPVFECQDRTCGGFDFRFGTEVVPAPDMHVDIRNYRYFAAVDDTDRAISVLISRSRNAAYVQIIRVGPPESSALSVVPDGETRTPPAVSEQTDLIVALVEHGHVILPDLEFQSGADTLGDGTYQSLEKLAGYLNDTPGQRIALVGHTDSAGSLDGNISLSKRRAASVRDRLVQAFDISPDRIEAEGMGYLAPVASNLTAQGREANRRVEAILLSAP